MNSGNLNCPFRIHPRRQGNGEIATCGLVQQLLQTESNGGTDDACQVSRDACEACSGSTPVASSFVNGVFPSILNEACTRFLHGRSSDDGPQTRRATELLQISEAAVLGELVAGERRLPSCDVYLCCDDASAATRRSIESVLAQQNAAVNLHLILNGPRAQILASDYATTWNVHLHRLATATSLFAAVHELAPTACSEFLALQHADAVAMPNRIANAVGELCRMGADAIGSPLLTPAGEVAATEPTDAYQASIPWPTLVMRRSAFIDLGGFADRKSDPDLEWIHRAKRSGAKIRVMPLPSVELHRDWQPPKAVAPPAYVERLGSLRHHAIGYPQSTVPCDVVIPVYGQLDFVAQAIESIIQQQDAEPIVHLIDDRGPENVDALFRYWGSLPNVRLYRNRKNVGQYVSFNNVSPYFETDFVAVQDGDDISLPHRLETTVNLLERSDADFFAATMEQFAASDAEEAIVDRQRFRRSHIPYGNQMQYFAMNPTACFRVAMFRRLGGYSDFGDRDRNRCGLDSEFMIRASHSAVRFAISSSVVTRYRVHPQSATRNSETGFGTDVRTFSLQECRRRAGLYQRAAFDPRSFGALGRYRDVTERVISVS
ncbi:Putative glycosyltransferase EpsE [Stieleria maiorica]|uniref:Glycosyltransferase EpsE n=1 Tax=Stieleria maiorica TaxID=2795974 RepID=A0A5B9MC62_9BACT|nr:glycosyltransferase [Stieleria maiorica]QEF97610.1 Putative glycosyltransferase EpsE [Stieleria maiorica]